MDYPNFTPDKAVSQIMNIKQLTKRIFDIQKDPNPPDHYIHVRIIYLITTSFIDTDKLIKNLQSKISISGVKKLTISKIKYAGDSAIAIDFYIPQTHLSPEYINKIADRLQIQINSNPINIIKRVIFL